MNNVFRTPDSLGNPIVSMAHTPVQPKAQISLETFSCEEIQLSGIQYPSMSSRIHPCSLFQLAESTPANPYLSHFIMSSPIQVSDTRKSINSRNLQIVDNNTSETPRSQFTIYIVTVGRGWAWEIILNKIQINRCKFSTLERPREK